MKKMYGFILVVIFVCIPVIASAEDITITTYYPSPYGSYNELQTANNTYLATTGGFVGIGNTTASEKLDVTGNIRATGSVEGNTLRATNLIDGPGIIRQILHVLGTTNEDTNSTSYVNLAGMDINLTTVKSTLFITWNVGVANYDVTGAGTSARIRVLVDGVQVSTYQAGAYTYSDHNHVSTPATLGDDMQITMESMGGNAIAAVNAGAHTVSLQWLCVGCNVHPVNRIYSTPNDPNGYGRSMTVMEIQRL